MDYSDQRYGALVPVAVLDADGQELEATWSCDELDGGPHVPDLIGNLNDDCGDWLVHRTDAIVRPRGRRQSVPGPQERLRR